MSALWEIAPPITWAAVATAAILLLVGFVLLSHTLLRRRAHGDRWSGLLHDGRLEAVARLGTAALLAGLGLWTWELAAPAWVWGTLGAGALLGLGLDAAARSRG